MVWSLQSQPHSKHQQVPYCVVHNASVEFALRMRRTALLFAGIALVATAAFSGDGNVRRSTRRIPGRYIVVLESTANTDDVANTVHNFKGAQVRHTYQRGFKGFELEMNDADAQTLARDARVQFVEEDATVSASATPWGLD